MLPCMFTYRSIFSGAFSEVALVPAWVTQQMTCSHTNCAWLLGTLGALLVGLSYFYYKNLMPSELILKKVLGPWKVRVSLLRKLFSSLGGRKLDAKDFVSCSHLLSGLLVPFQITEESSVGTASELSVEGCYHALLAGRGHFRPGAETLWFNLDKHFFLTECVVHVMYLHHRSACVPGVKWHWSAQRPEMS